MFERARIEQRRLTMWRRILTVALVLYVVFALYMSRVWLEPLQWLLGMRPDHLSEYVPQSFQRSPSMTSSGPPHVTSWQARQPSSTPS